MTDESGMAAMETVDNQYLGGHTSLVCAPETARRIDGQVAGGVKDIRREDSPGSDAIKFAFAPGLCYSVIIDRVGA